MGSDDLYIGLISGTSADGIDAALVSFAGLQKGQQPELVAHRLHPIPPNTRTRLMSLFTPNDLQIDLMGELDVEMGQLFADAAIELLQQAGVSPDRIAAIGSHGQTIRHRPTGDHPFTLQIADPNVISQRSGLDVVGDFRRRDLACGGEGAPLAPLFHQAVLSDTTENRVILNLGGIANVTLLPTEGTPLAMDTGPASGLMDAWCLQHRGEPFDRDGLWAAGGKAIEALVAAWLSDPYFSLPCPKSTGKEYFHLAWAQQLGGALMHAADPADVQASLLELTAKSVADAIHALPVQADRVLACGGGVHNGRLMTRLQQLVDCPLDTTGAAGVAPDWVEAMCFAWLAKQHLDGNRLKTAPFTGANTGTSEESILLGGLYRA